MTRRIWRWDDAETMARWLAARPTESDILHILARLPFLSEAMIGPLVGLSDGSHVYRCLGRLVAGHLVASIRPSLEPGRHQSLFYLTDLGLASLAIMRQVAPAEIARRNRLRQRDLLAHLPRLPLLLSCYELLTLLVQSRCDAPRIRTWEYLWQRRFQPATVKAPVSIILPAGVTLAGRGETASYVLLPDLGSYPVRLFRRTLDRLLLLRGQQRGP